MKQNPVRLILLTVLFTFVTSALPLFAQQAMTLRFNPDSTFIIPELGAAVTQANDTLAVNMILPGQPSGDNANAELKKGDVVLAVNGKSVKSAKKLRAAYDALKVGDMVKLTIRRNGTSKTLGFKKADVSKLPGPKVIRRTVGSDGVKTKTDGK